MYVIARLILFLTVFFPTIPTYAAQGVKPSALNAFNFLNKAEMRKKQREKLQEEEKAFKKRASELRASTVEALDKIQDSLNALKKNLADAHREKAEYLNKKIIILNDRRQNLTNTIDLLKEIEEGYIKHSKVIGLLIDAYQFFIRQDSLKTIYTWQELRDAQAKMTEFASKRDEELVKKEILSKQRTNEKDTIQHLQKQIEVKTKEREKIVAGERLREAEKPLPTALEEDLYGEEILFLKERVTFSELHIEQFDAKIKLKEDEIELLEAQRSQQKNLINLMEERLKIDQQDVKQAKTEASEEQQKASQTKEQLNKLIDTLKLEKNQLNIRSTSLQKRTKDAIQKKKKDVVYYLALWELKKVDHHIHALEWDIDLLQVKQNVADALAQQADLRYQIVDLRYRLALESIDDLDSLITKFTNQKDIALSTLKKLAEKQQASKNAPLEITKESESLKLKKEKLLTKREALFKGAPKELQDILHFYEQIKKLLGKQLQTINNYLLVSANLQDEYEKIIAQYTMLIDDLKARKTADALWKRSPKAISFEAFQESLLEAENFFKQLFWDTPNYLGATALLTAIQNIHVDNFLGLIFFVLFFILLYVSFRFVLNFVLRRLRSARSVDHKYLSLLSLNIVISLIEWSLTHLGLLVLWIFLYLHILFKFSFIFATIDFINQPYYIALFYLVSIPVLVYLSRGLIASLRKLNKKLSFFFFAEQLENRFILLITSVCYSTAILLPIRLAFLSYYGYQQPTNFPNVINAAYSLILVIILLLFFSKDDVIRLIPAGHPILDWLRRQVDTHYYPVFLFFMSLLIIINPYIGYFNLAWYLAFAVPVTTLLIYALFFVHYYIRKYAFFLFLKEEEEEIFDKFEYAKTYYGLLIIFSFLALLLATFFVVSRIWGVPYAVSDMIKLFSEKLTFPIGADHKFGFVELAIVIMFIVGGFITSSLTSRFILNKLFDIMRTDPGMQNTIAKILHYTIMMVASFLGFTYVQLAYLIWYVGTFFAVAFGLALKDVVSDFVAGFFVLIERPIEIGSYITIDNNPLNQGTVQKIDARTTTIVNRLHHVMIVPNHELVAKKIDNWGKGRFAVGFEIFILVDGESCAPDAARKIIMDVIQNNPILLRVPRPEIRLEDFKDNALYFLVRPFISTRRVKEQWAIAAMIREDLFKAFKEHGIKFGLPQRVVHVKQGSEDVPSSPITFKFGDNQ